MSLYLNVPFAEKDEAKCLGAWWDSEKKKWYVRDKKDYAKFQKWILKPNEDECMILCDHFYIIEGKHTCFKCKSKTKVIGFGVENFYTFYQKGVYDGDPQPEYSDGEVHIADNIDILSQKLLEYLKQAYNYYYGYSNFTKTNYYGNHCTNCGVLQGNFYLFNEVDSPFCIDSIEAATNLTLYKVKLPFDQKVQCSIGYGSEDNLIKKHAKIVDLEVVLDETKI